MVRYNFLLSFCDVAKMAMIYKKTATFGYRQVMWLETCLNPSILRLLIIFCCKKMTMYVFNFTKRNSFKKILSWCCCPLKLSKIGH
jgi:hypothetical protein